MSEPTPSAHPADEIDALRAAESFLARDGRVALATVVSAWGSAPVPVGGQMAIATDGRFQGSVSGGCIEGDVIAHAEAALHAPAVGAPKTLTFGVSDETAWNVGLPCGGEISVLLERIDRDSPAAAVLSRASRASTAREGLVLRTRLSDGHRELFERRTPGLPEDIARRFRTGKSALTETAAGPVFVQALVPPARILVVGATHIAQVLAEIARLSGYDLSIVDPRTAFAAPGRFPGVALYPEWPQDAIPRIGLDPYTAVVVLAHVAHIDDEALKLALVSDCLYVGALGSRRNHEKRTERLKEAGFTDAQIARIKCPIGLDIGAQTPAEIAVSVMAEVVLAARGAKSPAV